MAPEYAMHGYLTDKADVYSFGIVALEIVCGKSASLERKGNLMDLVDERLGEDFKRDEVMVMINVALLCTQVSPLHRPTMASVVCMLEGKTDVQDVVLDTSQVLDGKKLEVIQQYYRLREKNKTHDIQEESISMAETSAFMSDTDLYSVNMDSSY
ncbi:LRR receptor serine/threonine-protein kinase [Spatholobus suberectus]|nr:LRR receptor serine/threonine-protein kinase [Spatholobus suberectus]